MATAPIATPEPPRLRVRFASGQVEIEGRPVVLRSPSDARLAGISIVFRREQSFRIQCALGVVAAMLFSSAGPIFFDRLFGGARFALLGDTLAKRGAWIVLALVAGLFVVIQIVVLIMGLATQMIAWPDELCEGLARRGLFVVRFDNRDVGESTHLRNLPPPRLADIVVRRRPPPYSIGDMARDVAGLIDGLGLGEVHLVGASMGGFIAQAVALEHAARVRTLTLMMTSTGSRRAGQPRPRVYARLLRRRVSGDRPAAIARCFRSRLLNRSTFPGSRGPSARSSRSQSARCRTGLPSCVFQPRRRVRDGPGIRCRRSGCWRRRGCSES